MGGQRINSEALSRRHVLGRAGAVVAAAMLAPATGRASGSIKFGLTPVFLSNDLELLDLLRNYLTDATGGPVELITRRTYQEITALLVSGQLDAAWICGYPFVQFRQELTLLATPLWNGEPLYQSFLIVSHAREVSDWVDLEGDIHAFSDPDSNSGFLVTRALLASRGMGPEEFFFRHFYTYGHRNVIRAVASGLAQSGSVDGYVYEVMRDIEPALIAQTRIVRHSEWLGFPPIAASTVKAGDERIVELQRALLLMDQHESGRKVLALLRLDGFASSDPALFDTIAEKVDLIRRLG